MVVPASASHIENCNGMCSAASTLDECATTSQEGVAMSFWCKGCGHHVTSADEPDGGLCVDCTIERDRQSNMDKLLAELATLRQCAEELRCWDARKPEVQAKVLEAYADDYAITCTLLDTVKLLRTDKRPPLKLEE